MSVFVSDDTINEIADDMQSAFHFTLHSQSRIAEIVPVAREQLADRGLPTRASLCVVIAKRALMRFRATVEITHMALDS